MTIRERIWNTLQGSSSMLYHGTRPIMTASDIVRYANYSAVFRPGDNLPDLTLASVSSVLRRMVGEGKILRVKGYGPRGGYGYARPLDIPFKKRERSRWASPRGILDLQGT